MNGLPTTWCTSALGLLIQKIDAGLNVKCEERPPQSGEKGLVKISAVTWGCFNQEQSKTLPADVEVNESARISAGDLLISRANTIELVGASVVVGRIDKRLYLSDKVLRLVVPNDSRRWVNYALKIPSVRKAIEDSSSGNQLSMRNISQDKLRSIEIPLAPLAEQKRIADKLDAVLARVDACRDCLSRVPLILKRFRQSVLAAATSGNLTIDWREKTSTDGLRFSDKTLPHGWKSILLQTYAKNHDGKRVPISEELRRSRRGDFPYYGASGVIDTIDGFTHDGKFVLIGEDGANLLTRAKPIAFITEGKSWINNHAHVLSCKNGEPEEYLCYYINSIDLTPYVTGSAQPKLTQKNMNSIPIPVPPIQEQNEIVRRVELLFAFADRLEARLAAARTIADRLTPALLAKAFRGELVPQDANDEPAAKLLKRLAAASKPATKGKRGSKSASTIAD